MTLTASFHLPTDIQLIVFDMAGTTVNDEINGVPLVTHTFQKTFKTLNIPIQADELTPLRGMNKRAIVETLINNHNVTSVGVDEMYSRFLHQLDVSVKSIGSEIEGTSQLFQQLRQYGIKIAVASGFNKSTVDQIITNLNWSSLVDYIAADVQRPNPDAIHQAMHAFEITEPRRVVKVGDTVVDVEEGRNAGCWTVAVTTGTQTREQLARATPDAIIQSVTGLTSLLQSASST